MRLLRSAAEGLNKSREKHTHRGAAHSDDDEGPDDTSDSHQPGHPEEQDHPEDVLDARQVHAHQGAELGSLEESLHALLAARWISGHFSDILQWRSSSDEFDQEVAEPFDL